jgi:hypothetical protein
MNKVKSILVLKNATKVGERKIRFLGNKDKASNYNTMKPYFFKYTLVEIMLV